MKQRSPYIIACIFFALLGTGTLLAQSGKAHHGHGIAGQSTDHPPVVLKATVDKQRILIGEPIHLMLEATLPANLSLNWPALDSLPHFDWVEKGNIDSVVRPDGHYYRQYLTITSFDSGSWSIPRLAFLAGNHTYFSDSIRVDVGYSKFDPSKDYHDIKDIIDVPNPFAKWIGWIVAAVTLCSVALVIWLIKRKRKQGRSFVPVATAKLEPFEEAMRQLEVLEKERMNLADNGSVKVYYTRLNDILRQFVFRKLGIASLAETNEELISEIRQLPLKPDQFARLSETLRMSDFVKFAKYRPDHTDNEQNIKIIRSSIEQLNSIEK